MLRAEVTRQGGRIVPLHRRRLLRGVRYRPPGDPERDRDPACAHVARRDQRFAPPVRIGLHAADATQRGEDFSGVGVHVAARIAALAGGGEILASAEALAEAADVAAIDVREVQVRGVSDRSGWRRSSGPTSRPADRDHVSISGRVLPRLLRGITRATNSGDQPEPPFRVSRRLTSARPANPTPSIRLAAANAGQPAVQRLCH